MGGGDVTMQHPGIPGYQGRTRGTSSEHCYSPLMVNCMSVNSMLVFLSDHHNTNHSALVQIFAGLRYQQHPLYLQFKFATPKTLQLSCLMTALPSVSLSCLSLFPLSAVSLYRRSLLSLSIASLCCLSLPFLFALVSSQPVQYNLQPLFALVALEFFCCLR
ncbi:hypothetical protein BDY19DRAFT_975803 [Irpex rosettiformis]|uniref:Uncharacterized protein n=1 Tax=Irpex rosettiformis TaxID=378272 RepID=A0ACB8TP65_9APHY|nr:hypothetical protein BDY19DRAFT_975803 [Irpex rosettiformis]